MIATLTAMDLASSGKPKSFVFVSSTSAVDTEHYVNLSETFAHGRSDYQGIPENDDLEGAKINLKTGYGQSKWVSEKLLFEAGKRGLNGHIVRPGYVVGDSRTAGERNACNSGFFGILTLFFFKSDQYRRLHLSFDQGMHTTWAHSRHQ